MAIYDRCVGSDVMRPRREELRSVVRSLRFSRGGDDRGVHRVIPTGRSSIRVNLLGERITIVDGVDGRPVCAGAAVYAGPRDRPMLVDVGSEAASVIVDFFDGAAPLVLGQPASTARNEIVDLEQFWGRDGATLVERLQSVRTRTAAVEVIEVTLSAHLRRARPDEGVVAAAGALSRGDRVGRVARDLGVSDRTLRRRFTEDVGIAPKRFGRVRRLQRLLHAADTRPTGWADLAASFGYSDQAHLVDEFQSIAGVTPVVHRRARRGATNHLDSDLVADFAKTSGGKRRTFG